MRREKNEKRMQNDEKTMDCGWIAAGRGNYLGVSVRSGEKYAGQCAAVDDDCAALRHCGAHQRRDSPQASAGADARTGADGAARRRTDRAGVHCADHWIAGHDRREECVSDDDLRPAGAVRQYRRMSLAKLSRQTGDTTDNVYAGCCFPLFIF